MNNIEIFKNSEFGTIRTVDIDGNPWFVGKDIAEALGYSNASKAVMVHVDEEDKESQVLASDSQNGNVVRSKTTLVNESGLYSLALMSKLPTAKRFKRWVTSEVIPSIRKTGNYQNKPMTLTEIVASSANILVQHEKQLEKIASRQVEQDEQIKQVNKSVNNISNIVAINNTNWRHECDRILGKCAYAIDDNKLSYATNIKAIRADVYTQMREKYSIDLKTRLKNAQKKMERLGETKTKINKLNKIDIIARDKKAIMAYIDVCKQMAIKYQITL